MSRLKDLNKAKETLQKEHLTNEDLERQFREREEEIIKTEILPIITKQIEPALSEVQRELVIVVDYKPDQPISVHLSRKRNFKEVISDVVEILPDPPVEHKTINKPASKARPSKWQRLRVEYPNGDVIEEKTAKDTLIEFIRRTGYKKVRELALENKSKNLRAGGGILISNTLDSKYRSEQHEIAPGWYVCTHGPTIQKKRSIETISEKLGLRVKVTIV